MFSVAFAPDGKTLYSGGEDKTIKLWDWEEGRLRRPGRTAETSRCLAFSPDGQILAVATLPAEQSGCGTSPSKRPALPCKRHVGDVFGVAFSPDGRTLASAGRDHSVRLWDPVTGHELLTLKGHAATSTAITFSPDGTILATGSHDGAIKLWRASPGLADQKFVPRAQS